MIKYSTMGHRKRKEPELEPEYVEAEPISLILPEDISVAEFLGRRMRRSREGEKQKVDTAEKEADSPAEAVPSKKVGKKEKKSKKKGSFLDAKSKEVEQQTVEAETTEPETKHVIPLHDVLSFDFELVCCVIFMCSRL